MVRSEKLGKILCGCILDEITFKKYGNKFSMICGHCGEKWLDVKL